MRLQALSSISLLTLHMNTTGYVSLELLNPSQGAWYSNYIVCAYHYMCYNHHMYSAQEAGNDRNMYVRT